MNYWEECISIAAEECGLDITKEQIEFIAGSVESGHENYGMAYGSYCIPNPLQIENDKLKTELKKEKDKVICSECKGTGRIISVGPVHSCESECFKCRGKGRHNL